MLELYSDAKARIDTIGGGKPIKSFFVERLGVSGLGCVSHYALINVDLLDNR